MSVRRSSAPTPTPRSATRPIRWICRPPPGPTRLNGASFFVDGPAHGAAAGAIATLLGRSPASFLPRIVPLGGRIINADITKWTVEENQYDAVIALFQVVSYLLEPLQLVLAFQNIYETLVAGGIFTFDVVSALWAYSNFEPVYAAEVQDGVMVWKRELDEKKDILRAECFYYLKGKKKTDSHAFKIFTGPELDLVLKSVGFSTVEYYSGRKQLEPYSKSSPNLHIIAVK